jgi:tRNA-specific 2-thiouridylase
MDICFMANKTGIAELLSWHSGREPQPGDIVDLGGRVLGRHKGIEHYTVGQRRGLALGGGTEGLVVQRLDPRSNTVVVARPEECGITALELQDFVDMAPGLWQPGAVVQVQCRYRQQAQWAGRIYPRARVDDDGAVQRDGARVEFEAPVANVAGETVLCGGIIAEAESF